MVTPIDADKSVKCCEANVGVSQFRASRVGMMMSIAFFTVSAFLLAFPDMDLSRQCKMS